MNARLRYRLLGMIWLLLTGCSKDFLEVQYPQMLSPSENFAELKKLAVALDPKLSESTRSLVAKTLQECSLYSGGVQIMDKPARVSGPNPKDYIDALIKRTPSIQEAHGILTIQVEEGAALSQLDKNQAVVIQDLKELSWYPSYGVPSTTTLGFPQRPEVAPQWKSKKREALVRTEKLQYIIRLVLYNRVSGKVIEDRVINSQSVLANYSRKSSLKSERFVSMVERSVLDEALFYSCPARTQVKRRLFYMKNADALGQMVNEGVDLAKENRWNLAMTKWTNVTLKDPKQAFALHNLAVAQERQGEFFKAWDNFRLAQQGPLSKILPEKVFDELKAAYMPQVEIAGLFPQVAFVTGGNWVYLHASDAKLDEGRNYSVYRIEPLIPPDTSRTGGQLVREVGVIRVVGSGDLYIPARIREYLADAPIKPGDFLIPEI